MAFAIVASRARPDWIAAPESLIFGELVEWYSISTCPALESGGGPEMAVFPCGPPLSPDSMGGVFEILGLKVRLLGAFRVGNHKERLLPWQVSKLAHCMGSSSRGWKDCGRTDS